MNYELLGGMESGIHFTRFIEKAVADQMSQEEKPQPERHKAEGNKNESGLQVSQRLSSRK